MRSPGRWPGSAMTPYDRLLSMPAGEDPHERMAELGDAGFVIFTVDDDARLVRVYELVWAG
jgi:hypothetical protein